MEEEGGQPINGLLYEKYDDNYIKYYAFYKNGIMNGILAEFHKSGNLKSYCVMEKGTIDGEKTEWYENGIIKSKKNCKFGLVLNSLEWDVEGNVIREKRI